MKWFKTGTSVFVEARGYQGPQCLINIDTITYVRPAADGDGTFVYFAVENTHRKLKEPYEAFVALLSELALMKGSSECPAQNQET